MSLFRYVSNQEKNVPQTRTQDGPGDYLIQNLMNYDSLNKAHRYKGPGFEAKGKRVVFDGKSSNPDPTAYDQTQFNL